jgi:hypothetical protein
MMKSLNPKLKDLKKKEKSKLFPLPSSHPSFQLPHSLLLYNFAKAKSIINALHTPLYTSVVPYIRHITSWTSENLEQNQGTTWINQSLGQAQLASNR